MCDCNQFWVFLFALVLFSALHFFFFGYILPFFTISLANWEFNRRAESTYEMQAQWKKCTQNNYKCTDHFDRICERERKKKCRMMAFGMHKNQSNCVPILEHNFFPVVSHIWIAWTMLCCRLVGLSDSLGRVGFCLVRVRARLATVRTRAALPRENLIINC